MFNCKGDEIFCTTNLTQITSDFFELSLVLNTVSKLCLRVGKFVVYADATESDFASNVCRFGA